jgi:hypothetical protein
MARCAGIKRRGVNPAAFGAVDLPRLKIRYCPVLNGGLPLPLKP